MVKGIAFCEFPKEQSLVEYNLEVSDPPYEKKGRVKKILKIVITFGLDPPPYPLKILERQILLNINTFKHKLIGLIEKYS